MKKILTSSIMMAVMAVAPAAPVLAWWDYTYVYNENYAYVDNYVFVTANSGGNAADGGYAGGAGDGGSVVLSNDDNVGGNGGNGGNAGNAGSVHTGSASAGAGVTNIVNWNATTVDDCGCLFDEDEDFGDHTEVGNYNGATVINTVFVAANTGDNTANGGSTGGGAGNGGSVILSDDDNTGGNGGNGGDAGNGGHVGTGHADADADVVNHVNTNITTVNH